MVVLFCCVMMDRGSGSKMLRWRDAGNVREGVRAVNDRNGLSLGA